MKPRISNLIYLLRTNGMTRDYVANWTDEEIEQVLTRTSDLDEQLDDTIIWRWQVSVAAQASIDAISEEAEREYQLYW